MAIQLGQNFYILTVLMFSELLLIIIPILVSAKLEKKSVKEELTELGFFKRNKSIFNLSVKIILGIDIGIFLFLFSWPLLLFFRNIIVEPVFGSEFVEQGITNLIKTEPLQPTNIEIVVIVILQIIITGPSEEGFFRGFMIQKLKRKLRLVYSLILSSTIFTLYHLPPFLVPIQTIILFSGYFFVIGLIFGIIFVFSKKSILICSVAHSIFNIIVLIT